MGAAGPYPCAIDEQHDTEQSGGEAFEQRTGFFRTRKAKDRDARFDGWKVSPGPVWSVDEANSQIRDFLERLGEDRELEHHDDPAELARVNGMMVMFGPDEQLRFHAIMDRLPPELATEWEDLLSGGSASDAFGPLTLDEQLDEAQMARSLEEARKKRRVSVVLGVGGAILLVAVVVGAFLVLRDDPAEQGEIIFEEIAAEAEEDIARDGPPPEVNEALSAPIDFPLVVEAGDEPQIDRVVDRPDAAVLPIDPGSVWTTVMQYAGRPQVILVGAEDGWHDDLCVLLTATTADLRPVDVAYYEGTAGACGEEALGRQPTKWCDGERALMFDLDVDPGDIDLIEGGSGRWSAVRVQLREQVDGLEFASVRGVVEVGQGQTQEVPQFGGDEGTDVEFDLGEVSGSCTLQ